MSVKRKRKEGGGQGDRLNSPSMYYKESKSCQNHYHLMETRYQLQSKSLITPKFFPEVLKGEYVFFLIRI
jgi:hypothetical protein